MNASVHDVSVEKVQDFPDASFHVEVVSPDGSQSAHTVSLSRHYYEELTNGAVTPEGLIDQSFRFLLERETKESILASFDLPTISQYFPEYEHAIKRDAGHM